MDYIYIWSSIKFVKLFKERVLKLLIILRGRLFHKFEAQYMNVHFKKFVLGFGN